MVANLTPSSSDIARVAISVLILAGTIYAYFVMRRLFYPHFKFLPISLGSAKFEENTDESQGSNDYHFVEKESLLPNNVAVLASEKDSNKYIKMEKFKLTERSDHVPIEMLVGQSSSARTRNKTLFVHDSKRRLVPKKKESAFYGSSMSEVRTSPLGLLNASTISKLIEIEPPSNYKSDGLNDCYPMQEIRAGGSEFEDEDLDEVHDQNKAHCKMSGFSSHMSHAVSVEATDTIIKEEFYGVNGLQMAVDTENFTQPSLLDHGYSVIWVPEDTAGVCDDLLNSLEQASDGYFSIVTLRAYVGEKYEVKVEFDRIFKVYDLVTRKKSPGLDQNGFDTQESYR